MFELGVGFGVGCRGDEVKFIVSGYWLFIYGWLYIVNRVVVGVCGSLEWELVILIGGVVMENFLEEVVLSEGVCLYF